MDLKIISTGNPITDNLNTKLITDNILKIVLSELDVENRIRIMKFINSKILEKYSVLKTYVGHSVWENLVKQDQLYIDKSWLETPVNNQNDKLLKSNSHTLFNKPDAINFLKKCIASDCSRVYYINGYYQELIYNTYYENGDLKMRDKLIHSKRHLNEYIDKGLFILCVLEDNNPLDAYYNVVFKSGDNEYSVISTLQNNLDVLV